eukprot:CAMPEP_0185703860 /NCGR_PEP_ID=MMETSP1164-20130828/15600_1 /TAXON_ID=1104430 /ORGANISM="Chrysoreinhardia sp, Strain CCMP2950" /LENGTH=242 /DNA_ID=CAMNT_0028371177 /DNA_START=19 /DNA_END=747 /DNA_ORIENTATION=-
MSIYETKFKQASADEMGALEESLPDKILDIDVKLGTAISLSEAETRFTQKLDPTKPTPNETVAGSLSTARAEAAACVLNLRKIERFIQLHVPTVEDGGNFGVAVQLEILKGVVERRTKVKELFDGVAAYHKDRAALWKDVAPKTSTDHVEATTKETTADDDKTTTTKATTKTTDEKKRVATDALPDALAAIAALDVSWYFHAFYVLEVVRDAYIVCGDAVAKNRAKLERPKGDSGSNSMTMF